MKKCIPIPYFDTHNHTAPWSIDATQDIDSLLAEAKAKGVSGICLTNHYDLEGTAGTKSAWSFDIAKSFADLQKYREETSTAKDGVPLLFGIELGYNPNRIEEIRHIAQSYPFDQIILSLHSYHGKDPFLHPNLACGNLKAFYASMLETMLEMMQAVPEANIIGHIDFFSRYLNVPDSKLRYAMVPNQLDALFRHLIANNQALEVNLKSIWSLERQRGYSFVEALPDRELLERYLELGGTLVTLASDAHHQGDLSIHAPSVIAYLAEIGFAQLVHYEKQKAVLTSIRTA